MEKIMFKLIFLFECFAVSEKLHIFAEKNKK